MGKLTATPSLRMVVTSLGSDGLGPWAWYAVPSLSFPVISPVLLLIWAVLTCLDVTSCMYFE